MEPKQPRLDEQVCGKSQMVALSLNPIIFQKSYKFFLLVLVAALKGYSMKKKMQRLLLLSYSSSLFCLLIMLSIPKSLQAITGSWVFLALLIIDSCD